MVPSTFLRLKTVPKKSNLLEHTLKRTTTLWIRFSQNIQNLNMFLNSCVPLIHGFTTGWEPPTSVEKSKTDFVTIKPEMHTAFAFYVQFSNINRNRFSPIGHPISFCFYVIFYFFFAKRTRNAAVGPNILISSSSTNASYELVNSLLFPHKLRINKGLFVSLTTALFGHSTSSRSSLFARVVYGRKKYKPHENVPLHVCAVANRNRIGPGRACTYMVDLYEKHFCPTNVTAHHSSLFYDERNTVSSYILARFTNTCFFPPITPGKLWTSSATPVYTHTQAPSPNDNYRAVLTGDDNRVYVCVCVCARAF